jgi:hypothetical protein
MKKSVVLTLFFIFILAYLLRVLYLPKLALTFGYDQARDAFVAQQIIDGDIKILGPPASTQGLFHGVFYYYFLAPAYLIGNGDPIAAAYWIALFNALGVFLVFFLTYLMTDREKPSLLAAFLFAISYGATQYATWLSNPTIGTWTVPLIYIGLWLWVNGSKKFNKLATWGPAITAIGFGLSIQAEIFLAYHLVPILIWLWVARTRINKSQIVQALVFLMASVSSMILVEFKFGFKSLAGLSSLLGISSQDTVLVSRDVADFVVLYLNQIGRTFSNNMFPSNIGYGGALGLGFLYFVIKRWRDNGKKKEISWEPFLLTYILAHLPVVSVGGVSTPFLTVGLGSATVIIIAISIWKLSKNKNTLAKVLLLLIVVSNISAIVTRNKQGQVIFAIQRDLLLAGELKVIDYTYEKAAGEPFSINTLTSPLWINTVWSYLYNWYGMEKYGYLPEWRGRDQVGQLGNNLPDPKDSTSLHFFIKEPPQGMEKFHQESELEAENARSILVETKAFRDLEVQHREIRK